MSTDKLLKSLAVAALLLCIVVSSSATAARADSTGAATVTASALNMRSEANTTSSIVTTLTKGTVVLVTGSEGGWYKVSYQGSEGYMLSDYLTFSQTATANLGTGTVTSSNVRVRSGPGTGYSILGVVNSGTTLTVTGVSADWLQVSYGGSTGYISSAYVSVGGSSSGSSSSGSSSGSSSSGSTSVESVSGTGTIKGNYVRVRSGPGTGYSILGVLSNGTTLTVTGKSGDWYQVSYSGSTGYVSGAYMTLAESSSGSSSGGTTPASGTGTINANGVRLRSGPSTSSSILGSFSTGATMTVTGTSGDWYQVNYNGTTGYVYKTYLTVGSSGSSSTSTTGGSSVTVTDMTSTTAWVISAVHMRTGPDTSYSSMRVLSTGTSVTLTGYTDKWYRVTYNGETGYVFKTYLSTAEPSTTASSEGARIVAAAKKYLGVPYVYGGTSPSGFDCSGLVYYVYRECGYSITRTATSQNSDGYYVSRANLQPGDIIIFYNTAITGIGHSGIYIGNNQFIHASSGAGKVIISELTGYYDTRYYSARRVVG